jgi:hypothetical protein
MIRERALATAILVLSIVAPVAADPFEDGVAAHNRGDYATAIRLLLPLAEQGLAKAQVNLGLLYFIGQGVPQNDAEAVKWFGRLRIKVIASPSIIWGSFTTPAGAYHRTALRR